MTFSDFDLHPDLLDSIEALNYQNPTPIQQQAIPLILEGRDLIGVAQTGTGKTAAFVLPLIDKILDSGEEGFIQAVIVVPTRELAVQIDQVIEACSYFTGVSSTAIYGGSDAKNFGREKTALTSGVDIVVATPGRLLAHLKLGYVDFKRIRFLVIDEADRMLDMGFMPDLQRIINTLNPKRQNLLFSATMPPGVLRLANTILQNPATVTIAASKPAEGVTQQAYVLHEDQKIGLLAEILKDRTGERIIIFGSTKQSVNRLYTRLKSRELPVGIISSDVEQDKREQIMLDYRTRRIDILVATDVLSRGIDVEGIDLVVNFDVPRDAEDYVHRIGRTARAERKGTAITFISPEDQLRFRRIEQLINREVEKMPVPEAFGPTPPYDPRRIKSVSGGNGRPKKKPFKQASASHKPAAKSASAPLPSGEPKDGQVKPKRKKRRRGPKKPASAPPDSNG